MAKKKAKGCGCSVAPIKSVAELEDRLSTPSAGLVEMMKGLKGDVMILGAGGKVGMTLTLMAGRAVKASGVSRRVIAASRTLPASLQRRFKTVGVESMKANLMEPGVVEGLPEVKNIIYLCGHKFGSTGAEWNTWAINVFLAGLVARRFQKSRIVAFSSGNIYPFLPIGSGGATEATAPSPIGEYAMSCLGRERMFDYYGHSAGAKVLQFRLNYAAELRYGIMYDVASKVYSGEPIDVTMGNVNVVWQGYVSDAALRCLELADSPPRILNVTGPETVSIRWMAERFGKLMGKTPRIEGTEAPNALLSNSTECHRLFGYPDVTVDTLIEWVAQWVMAGGESLGKPTHYETRDGKF